jgi:hypothetical protein
MTIFQGGVISGLLKILALFNPHIDDISRRPSDLSHRENRSGPPSKVTL